MTVSHSIPFHFIHLVGTFGQAWDEVPHNGVKS
jgi:hypothetical protein